MGLLSRLTLRGATIALAVPHHVGDFELAQIEHAAEHVAVELFDAALAVQEVHRTA